MGAAKGISLAKNYSSATPAAGSAIYLPGGGRMVLVIIASAFPTTCQLQYQAQDGSTWVNVGSNLTANGITSFDLPSGQYRLNMASGTATSVYADLVSVPYV